MGRLYIHREAGDFGPMVVLETIASIIMDLDEEVLHIAEGPPCRSQYTEHRLSRAEHAEV